jgi:glucuronide carrier protein
LARFLGRYATSATVLDDASIPVAQAQDAVMVEENTSFVKEAAEGGTVMLGRNAALIIGDIPNALHVLLDAPVEVRIARAAREEGLDLAHAARRQRNEDRIEPRCQSASTTGTPWN